MGTVLKMYGAITGGTQDAIAMIDVPMPGRIIGVQWSLAAVLATDYSAFAQLSFRPAGSFTTNDDRGVLSEVYALFEITTTGAGNVAVNQYSELPEVPIMGGERLYIHSSATASVAGRVIALLHFDFDLDKISMRRR